MGDEQQVERKARFSRLVEAIAECADEIDWLDVIRREHRRMASHYLSIVPEDFEPVVDGQEDKTV